MPRTSKRQSEQQRKHQALLRMHAAEKAEFGGNIKESEIREWEDMAATNAGEPWAMPLWRAATYLWVVAQENQASKRLLAHAEQDAKNTAFEQRRKELGW